MREEEYDRYILLYQRASGHPFLSLIPRAIKNWTKRNFDKIVKRCPGTNCNCAQELEAKFRYNYSNKMKDSDLHFIATYIWAWSIARLKSVPDNIDMPEEVYDPWDYTEQHEIVGKKIFRDF